MRSHSVVQGGAAAVMQRGDFFEQHAYDTVKGSDFLADQDAVESFVRGTPSEILQLELGNAVGQREGGKPTG